MSAAEPNEPQDKLPSKVALYCTLAPTQVRFASLKNHVRFTSCLERTNYHFSLVDKIALRSGSTDIGIALDSNFIDHFAIYNVHGDLGNGFHILIISSLIGKNRERWLRESFVNYNTSFFSKENGVA